MAITNHERVGKSLELLKDGLGPFVEREFKAKYGDEWAFEVKDILSDTRLGDSKTESLNDVATLLVVMDRKWGDVFRRILGKTERSLVNEILAVRNRWAHQDRFSSDDAYRALDSVERLLTAISAPQADEVDKTKMELLRVRFDEQARGEKRKSSSVAIGSGVTSSLKPWREVVTPHEDVASGRYQQAEFAADLWQVHMGEGNRRISGPGGVFSPYLPDGESQRNVNGCSTAVDRGWRRSCRAVTDQLRWWQNAFDVGALSSVFRDCADRTRRN